MVPALRAFFDSWSTLHCATLSLHPHTTIVSLSGSTAAVGVIRTRVARVRRVARNERDAGLVPAIETHVATLTDVIVSVAIETRTSTRADWSGEESDEGDNCHTVPTEDSSDSIESIDRRLVLAFFLRLFNVTIFAPRYISNTKY